MGYDDWRQRAACRGHDTAIFFVGDPRQVAEAKRVCAGCPVRDDCLAEATAAGWVVGVWGGLTQAERWRDARVAAGWRCSAPSRCQACSAAGGVVSRLVCLRCGHRARTADDLGAHASFDCPALRQQVQSPAATRAVAALAKRLRRP